MAQAHLSQSSDKLASLRIDRTGGGRRPRSRWGIWLFFLFMLPGMIVGGAYAWLQYGELWLRPEVRVASAEARTPGAADSVLAAQGYLKSEKQAAIGAKVAGRIFKVFVKEGHSVKKGTELAELEHADMDAQLDAMKASLEAMDASMEGMVASLEKAKAELSEAQSTLVQDERDFARSEQLYRNKGLSGSEYKRAESKVRGSQDRRDSLQAAVTLAEARQRETKARRREAQARMQEAQEQRKNMFVTAPFDGTVISKEAEEGESIMPGGMGAASGRGSVVTLADLLHLEVETDVKEDYISRVRKDQEASVAVDAVPNRRFRGKVRTIIPMGDRARGTVKVKVQLNEEEVREVNPTSEHPDRTPTLFPEMAATVHFMNEGKEAQSGNAEPQVYAPTDCIRKDDNAAFVWQVVNERVKRVTIETGDSREGRVLIQRGLKGGEQLVVNPPDSLKEDMTVKVVQ